MGYDGLELDRIENQKAVALFLGHSQAYNFLAAIVFCRCSISCESGPTMFTAATCPIMCGRCEMRRPTKAQVPSLKSMTVIRSQKASLTFFYQQLAQCKTTYHN